MNLVFFDIDGTLANRTDVPQSAQRAIRKLREHGDLVWICTGRPISYAKKHFHRYANGYICSNGREGFTCCAKIFDQPYTTEEVQFIQTKLDEVKAGYTFQSGKQVYFFGPEESYDALCGHWDQENVHRGGDLTKIPLYNMDIWYRDQQHFQDIKEALQEMVVLNPHGPIPTADVTVGDVTKGTALRFVAEYMNVPIENTYAFGDGMNDISMFEAAGHTVAMGNAVQELKDAAEFVTSDINEDGVWNGLLHYHLIQE